MLEIEVKIPFTNRAALEEIIISQGAVLWKANHSEDDTLYDNTERSLTSKECALRLRIINGKKAFLTFKGARLSSRKFKIRKEYETEVKNIKQMRKILQALGYQPVFQYQKFRSVFRKKKLVICMDKTPIGNFLELEGEQSDIVRFARSLGFSKKDFIKEDYITLMQAAGKSMFSQRG